MLTINGRKFVPGLAFTVALVAALGLENVAAMGGRSGESQSHADDGRVYAFQVLERQGPIGNARIRAQLLAPHGDAVEEITPEPAEPARGQVAERRDDWQK